MTPEIEPPKIKRQKCWIIEWQNTPRQAEIVYKHNDKTAVIAANTLKVVDEIFPTKADVCLTILQRLTEEYTRIAKTSEQISKMITDTEDCSKENS